MKEITEHAFYIRIKKIDNGFVVSSVDLFEYNRATFCKTRGEIRPIIDGYLDEGIQREDKKRAEKKKK